MTEITDEQRAAVEWLRLIESDRQSSSKSKLFARTALSLLPSELTNPQPVLPTEPGWYVGRDHSTWRCTDGVIRCLVSPERKAQDFAPFTRLVPERPQITREQVASIVHLARNGTQVIDDLLALVNGADQ